MDGNSGGGELWWGEPWLRGTLVNENPGGGELWSRGAWWRGTLVEGNPGGGEPWWRGTLVEENPGGWELWWRGTLVGGTLVEVLVMPSSILIQGAESSMLAAGNLYPG